MTMYAGRRTQWRSLASLTAMAAAAAIAVPLIGSAGRHAPVPTGTAATAGIEEAALSRDGSAAEARALRAAPTAGSERVSGRPAFMLYMLMEAARGSPLFSH